MLLTAVADNGRARILKSVAPSFAYLIHFLLYPIMPGDLLGQCHLDLSNF